MARHAVQTISSPEMETSARRRHPHQWLMYYTILLAWPSDWQFTLSASK